MGLIVPDYPVQPWNVTAPVYMSTYKSEIKLFNSKFNYGIWTVFCSFRVYSSKEARLEDPENFITTYEIGIEVTSESLKSIDLISNLYGRLGQDFQNGLAD